MSGCARLIVITRGIGLIALCTVLLYNIFKFNVIFHCCIIVDGHIIGGYQTVLEPLAQTCPAVLAVSLTINNLDVGQFQIYYTKLALMCE